ncbi:aconitate hydratase [Metallumcola ferriviriculae]|uniref:Aconitate hydratase n=1 Tax=Metallumcola ferriviriculae TaxID=3039180 RepID=A0AAU0UTW7_9FIRM|nr:aconitate hydratase [Desulfitibacteraceae bacterium MK1]
MGKSAAEKIISRHLVTGNPVAGEQIAIKIDQTLTQDATGTMAYLQFEAMGIPQVKTDLSVSYIDHNTLQSGFENADDHLYLQTVAAKHGVYFSRPGNGICHQVHLERFGKPGHTLLGSDSHTPTGGGLGMLAIGAGGLDVAVAMAGGPFYLTMPEIIKVELTGGLSPWVTAKDIILEVLRRLSVKGGVGKIIEYAGDGVKTLSVPERATITNMGAELGATTSIFPSDEVTKEFLKAQGREECWQEILADEDAAYASSVTIDLGTLEPLAAQPHSPDAVTTVAELSNINVRQVAIGSCTNSSFVDLMRVALILKGKTIHPDVSLVISPGSRQVFHMLADNGALNHLINAGARILESACGPCIGMGQSPPSGSVSVRTFNRNFKGRSGTADATIYLVSPETAAATALTGHLTDPRTLGEAIEVEQPHSYPADDTMVLPPQADPNKVSVRRGPNIKPVPVKEPLSNQTSGKVVLKTGDNITTDDIMPAGAKVLPLRSNIPAISEYVFSGIDPDFSKRTKELGGGIIIGGTNYGQGSSREHAALAPMYLGIKAVIAKSFARIHKANLVNFGILPLTFTDENDYDDINPNDTVLIEDIHQLKPGVPITAAVTETGKEIRLAHDLDSRSIEIVLAGGLLNYTKNREKETSQNN